MTGNRLPTDPAQPSATDEPCVVIQIKIGKYVFLLQVPNVDPVEQCFTDPEFWDALQQQIAALFASPKTQAHPEEAKAEVRSLVTQWRNKALASAAYESN